MKRRSYPKPILDAREQALITALQKEKKGLPIIGSFIGGLSDAYFMSRILRGAKMINHKRYLVEKGHRISLLKKTRASIKPSKKATNVEKPPRLRKRAKPKRGIDRTKIS